MSRSTLITVGWLMVAVSAIFAASHLALFVGTGQPMHLVNLTTVTVSGAYLALVLLRKRRP
mgnify:CR=1 FL=1